MRNKAQKVDTAKMPKTSFKKPPILTAVSATDTGCLTGTASVPIPARSVNYRKLAFQNSSAVCVHCGFGIKDVLEVAHLDGNRHNNDSANLAILCPNCHKMHDLDLISTEVIIEMRDRPRVVLWGKRMKDAGKKAAATRRLATERLKWRLAGLKAAQTRARRLSSATVQ